MLTLKTPAPERRGPLSTFSLGLIGATLAALAAAQPAAAGQLTTLYNFAGGSGDGCNGSSSLIFDSAGNLYGETWSGGEENVGTVFSLPARDSSDVMLHSFENYNFDRGSGGATPFGSLIFDSAGNLYGTTSAGGEFGYGTVFKLAPNGTFTTLHSFTGGGDGFTPEAGLVADSAGNLYGTTSDYDYFNPNATYFGTIFKIAPATGTLTTLYTFQGLGEGGYPSSDLVFDNAGNLYGTTNVGGQYLDGTVFEYTSGGQLRTLYSFTGKNDGGAPDGGVIFDAAGNLYGTTSAGGPDAGASNIGGTVFKLTPGGTLTTLYAFQGAGDGSMPLSDLIFDSAGSLYGVNTAGGASGNGTVFRLGPGSNGALNQFETLATLPGGRGNTYSGALVLDGAGTLYGTSGLGGTANCGTVYSIPGVAAPGAELSPSLKSLTFSHIALGGFTLGEIQTVKIEVKGGSYIPKTPLLTGANASEFSITSNTCTGIIANGGSCSITLQYAPAGSSKTNSTASLDLTGDATLAVGLVGQPALTLLPHL